MNPFYQSLEVIWNRPRFVHLDEEKLKEIAREIIKEEPKIPNWRIPVHWPGDDKNLVQFIGIENSINFAFRDFDTKQPFKIKDWRPEFKNREWIGSSGMVGCLLRAFEAGIPILDAKYLAKITDQQMTYIFRSLPGYSMPMLKQRTGIFREVGQVLLEKYNGSFWNIFERSGFQAFGSAGRLGIVDHLRLSFPSFNDISWHNQSQTWLQFHKRSQLLVMIYHGRALDSQGKLSLIQDINKLGAIADYKVPKILEYLGILEYAPILKNKILKQKLILPHSLMEQEIRAMTVLAMKRIMELTGYNICAIDYKFWSMGEKRIITPHHLTPTIFY